MHPPFITRYADGQVLLVSLLVLGFVALGFILIGSSSLMNSQQTSVVLENKALASASAMACMEQALSQFAASAAYAGNVTSTIGTQTCHIQPLSTIGTTTTILTVSQVGDQYARYQAVLSSQSPVVISSWAELTGF